YARTLSAIRSSSGGVFMVCLYENTCPLGLSKRESVENALYDSGVVRLASQPVDATYPERIPMPEFQFSGSAYTCPFGSEYQNPRFGVSCCQFLVGEMLSNYRNYERVQPLQGVTAHVADVKAERELIDIAMQVLLGNLMVNAVHSAFEHSPYAFDAVRAHAVLRVDSSRVIDGLMAKEQTVKPDVSSRFIREDRGTYFDVGMDCRLQCR